MGHLIEPIKILFNLCFERCSVPSFFLKTYITPLHKNGSRNDIRNYRGVANLCTIGKLFDCILSNYITRNYSHLINIKQHGFISHRSTLTNLVEFNNFAINNIERGSQVDAIYFDFAKAFDVVNIFILLQKLLDYGFNNNLIRLLFQYFSKRSQCVSIDGSSSIDFPVTFGVEQGSISGPKLFLYFINDLPLAIKYASILLFADDVKLFSNVSDLSDCLKLQSDIDNLFNWCIHNNMKLNLNKCKVMSFFRIKTPINFDYNIDDTIIERAQILKDLGIIYDNKLSFNGHIEYVIAKSRSLLGLIFRFGREFHNVYTLKNLFQTFIRTVLEYGSTVWNPYYLIHVNRIESIQK